MSRCFKPCASCPFRSDNAPREYVKGFPENKIPVGDIRKMAQGMVTDSTHFCHHTLPDEKEKGRYHEKKVCVGGVIFASQMINPRENISFCIAEMRGEINLDNLDQSIPIYDSIEELIEDKGC